MADPKAVPPLPPSDERMVSPTTGHPTVKWYAWFKRMEEFMRDHETRIAALEP